MHQEDVISRPRVLAHGVGVVLGIVAGILCFAAAMWGLLVGVSVRIGYLLVAVLAMLSSLPLSLLAIFKPRLAAYGIAVDFTVVLIGFVGWLVQPNWGLAWLKPVVGWILLLGVLPFCVVAGLLFYASSPAAAAQAGAESCGGARSMR